MGVSRISDPPARWPTGVAARPTLRDALKDGEVLEQVGGADLRVDAELLPQVPERLSQLILPADDVAVAGGEGAGVLDAILVVPCLSAPAAGSCARGGCAAGAR